MTELTLIQLIQPQKIALVSAHLESSASSNETKWTRIPCWILREGLDLKILAFPDCCKSKPLRVVQLGMTVQFLPTTTTTTDDNDDDDDVHAECETKCNYALTFQNKNCRFHFVLSEKNLYLSQLLLLSFLSEPFSDVGQTSFEDSIDRVCDGFSSFEFQRCGCCCCCTAASVTFQCHCVSWLRSHRLIV